MAVDQKEITSGTCTCGCCGTEEQAPASTISIPVMAAEPAEPEPHTGGCSCGEGTSGCACAGGADCTCGTDRVA